MIVTGNDPCTKAAYARDVGTQEPGVSPLSERLHPGNGLDPQKGIDEQWDDVHQKQFAGKRRWVEQPLEIV